MLNNNKKKKILFLLEAFDKGGIEKVTLDIVNHLDLSLYDIIIKTFWWDGYCQSLVRKEVKVEPFFYFKGYMRGVIRLIEYLNPFLLHFLFIRKQFDIEIAASDGGASKVISGCKNQNTKLVSWIHMDVQKRGSKLKIFKKKETAESVYIKFHTIVCVSEECKASFNAKFGFNKKTIVIRNPLPVERIRDQGSQQDFKFNKTHLNFVSVGRLVEQKGFDRLIKCCAKLINEDYFMFYQYIIGEGPLRKQLEQKIVDLNLNKNIFLIGFDPNPYKYIKQADMFILSSRDEATALVVGESIILGTPVLATECCGVGEWFNNDRFGQIVNNNWISLYEAMKSILKKPEIIKEFKTNIQSNFAIKDFSSSIKDFERILNL